MEHLEKTGRPFCIAIDISIWQFQIQAGQGGKNPALRTLYYRLLRLLGLSIQPLFVFDGPHRPPFKRGIKITPNAACLPNFLTKELLKRFGFPYHTAPGEAEAECALLQKIGLVDAVLSEDVDTMMFDCGMSLRNWTAEGTRGNKIPSHVNVYSAEATKKGEAGLDSQGMVLIALMSGGDYIPAGIPGCGPKTACEAARAGFGEDLCRLSRDDTVGLKQWRERLQHELITNESKFFRQKHKSMKIPESFPDQVVLGYYTDPVVSSPDKVSKLRGEIAWDLEVNVPELRLFVADAFDWIYLSGAKKFIRGLAPALLAHKLTKENHSITGTDESIEAKEQAEAQLVKAICDRRIHWNTDGSPELRIGYIPADIVGLDLEAEEVDPYGLEAADRLEVEQPESAGEARERSKSPTKRRAPSKFDPTEPERIWVLETYVKLGVPLLVETWEEDMRNPKKFATRKTREKKALSKGGMKPGVMDQFVKIGKPGSSQGSVPETSSKVDAFVTLPPSFLAPGTAAHPGSLQRKALSENRNPVGHKTENQRHENSKVRRVKAKKDLSADKVSPPSKDDKDNKVNPWTLSKRPADTFGVKSPTRYSALGIYGPDDTEAKQQSLKQTRSLEDCHQNVPSPPTLPAVKKGQTRLASPASDLEDSKNENNDRHDSARDFAGRSTPRHRDPSRPSPRKKRSPLGLANGLYLTRQPKTPTSSLSLRKLDRNDALKPFEIAESLALQKVNRRLDFSPPQASPASDSSSLPSPSTLMSPAPLEITAQTRAKSMPLMGVPGPSAGAEKKGRRLVALRESLEGAWNYLEPWETQTRSAKTAFSDVEVLDMTGS